MITPAELATYIETLKAAGVVGPVEVGGIKLTIAPEPVKQKDTAIKRSPKQEYDTMLFACTEGIPDEETT